MSDGSNDENILEEQDSEDEPIAPKSRKRKKVPNNYIKIESNQSQLMSKWVSFFCPKVVYFIVKMCMIIGTVRSLIKTVLCIIFALNFFQYFSAEVSLKISYRSTEKLLKQNLVMQSNKIWLYFKIKSKKIWYSDLISQNWNLLCYEVTHLIIV